MLRSLYVCYLSLEDPLVETQVVAYLAGLARRGHVIHLLTFETTALTSERRRALRARLGRQGITWHGLRYHKRPSLLATSFDVLCGACVATWLTRRHRLTALHARGHVPAAMALLARRMRGRFRLIFDIRGLMAEEYEDAGRWERDSVAFRLTKGVEHRALESADAVIVLTERVRQYLFGDGARSDVYVIPCCADLDQIRAATDMREDMRRRLRLEGQSVLVYVGKFTGWYMEREMVEFFALARERDPTMHFLVLTQDDPAPIESELTHRGVDASAWTITRAEPSAVGAYLAAADAAIAFIRPSFSKISSSPTKIGEYLAAGLPLVCIAGVGDVDEIIESYRVGVCIAGHDSGYLKRADEALRRLMADPDVSERCRTAAAERLSLAERGIPTYDAVYRRVQEMG